MINKKMLKEYGIWYDDPNDELKDLIKIDKDGYKLRAFFKRDRKPGEPKDIIMVNGMVTDADCILMYFMHDTKKIYSIDLRAGYWDDEICYINITIPHYNDNEYIVHISPAKIKGDPKDYNETAMHIVIGSGINNIPNEINLKED